MAGITLGQLAQDDLARMDPMQRAIYKNALMIGLVTPPWAEQYAQPQQRPQERYQFAGKRMMYDSPPAANNTGPGAYSTEWSTTAEVPGGFVNVPSMWGGRVLPDPVAVAVAREAGWPIDVIRDPNYADRIAAERSPRVHRQFVQQLQSGGYRGIEMGR